MSRLKVTVLDTPVVGIFVGYAILPVLWLLSVLPLSVNLAPSTDRTEAVREIVPVRLTRSHGLSLSTQRADRIRSCIAA